MRMAKLSQASWRHFAAVVGQNYANGLRRFCEVSYYSQLKWN